MLSDVLYGQSAEIIDYHITERGDCLSLVCCGQADDLGSGSAASRNAMK